MKKTLMIILSLTLILALSVIGFVNFGNGEKIKEKTIFSFDTVISLSVKGKDADAAIEKMEKEIYRLDKLFNVHSPHSEISNLNKNGYFSPVGVSKELYQLIERSVEYSKNTYGAFDITIKPLVDLWDIKSGKKYVPEDNLISRELEKVSYENIVFYPDNKIGFLNPETSLDLGAVAKGYAADRLVEIAKENKIDWTLIDLGGNVYGFGDRDFTIGIQDPEGERGEYFHTLKIKNQSVVTGGGYERGFEKDGKYYHHIISPFSGRCADSGLESVTVKGESSEKCDAYSTAVFVYGERLAKELSEKDAGVSFVIMDNEGNVKTIGND